MPKPFEVRPTADTVKNQRLAGDPQHSVWVSANAGSGKTHILTQRVLRLMLSGVAPENILCLTYTKAAAAEMKSRVSAELGKWAVLEEDALFKTLAHLTNARASSAQLARARTLFALALETPGGLKISTIHAFCEAALHRFPLEANVPVNFSVIEDAERARLIQNAKNQVLAQGLCELSAQSEAVIKLFSTMGDEAINKAVKSALGQSRALRAALAEPDKTKANLRQLLQATQLAPAKEIVREALEAFDFTQADCQRVFAITPPNSKQIPFEDKLERMDWDNIDLEDLFGLFLTQKGTVPASGFPKKKICKEDPALAEKMLAQARRLEHTYAELKTVTLITRSNALLDVMGTIQSRYETEKSRSGRLDFDDLIIGFEHLLSGGASADWVRYKLDAGMTHILVDESQDTNPDQWRVVNLLVDDFFSGDTAKNINRTIFGVGDEKQSIFGFQGAKPELFRQTGAALKIKAGAAKKPWENIRFPASFRTLENILEAVDILCSRKDIQTALLSTDFCVTHESARLDKGGSVTLWPPVVVEKEKDSSTQYPTTPPNSQKGGPRLTAERIVAQIKHWIDNKRPFGARGRAVVADDILILVQTRGLVFREVIRELKNQNIPTPGADRLSISDHIVIADLLALGDIMLDRHDDLTLAALLRCALFELSMDDLETICVQRPVDMSVWEALEQAAPTSSAAKKAFDELNGLKNSLDQSRPFEFFAELLFSRGGLKKLHGRLGEEIDDLIDVFLNMALEHEQSEQPSLQGFIASLRAQDIEVKRELSEGGGGVRVMTVHGAKGLEAPIVILADANKKPRAIDSVIIEGGDKPLFVLATKKEHTTQSRQAIHSPAQAREDAEYWRKLYVAMTRAEDELYITGVAPLSATDLKADAPQPSWYGAIHGALEGKFAEVDIYGETEKALRFPLNLTPPKEVLAQEAAPAIQKDFAPAEPLSKAIHVEIIRPSTAFEGDIQHDQKTEIPIGEILDAQRARQRGTALHLLLEHLVPIERAKRTQVGLDALSRLLPAEPDMHTELVDKANSILEGPHAQLLFGPHSRAELPVFVFAEKNRKPIQIIGRIDRIVADERTVLLVDFKSNANPPQNSNQIGAAYETQMGLYLRCANKLFETHKVSCAIYWTSNETLMDLDNDMLLKTTKGFNII
ncbi:MAG: double-strand break repair helicase AddA [Devosiaceae bacterium]|nr:double-strand break repair helicase AddA [Devosiaceae bacterium]